MENIERVELLVLSIAFLAIGVFGIADVQFFASSTGLDCLRSRKAQKA